MAGNFPEIWHDRVHENIIKGEKGSFLDGIAEINADVTVINDNELTEQNKIYVPATDFEVDVLINNTSYPLPVQNYDEGTIEITLDKYQPKVVTISDDAAMGASYDKIDTATRRIVKGIHKNKYQKAIHALAPASDATDTPILKATGGKDALTAVDGRKRLTYEDLCAFRERCENFSEIRLVLNWLHYNDLLLDRKNFGNQLVNYKKGEPMPFVAGIELTHYNGVMPVITTSGLTKKAYGSVKAAGDAVASVAFDPTAVGKKSGKTKQYFLPAKLNTRTQTNELGYRHYFIAVPYKNEKIGAII